MSQRRSTTNTRRNHTRNFRKSYANSKDSKGIDDDVTFECADYNIRPMHVAGLKDTSIYIHSNTTLLIGWNRMFN